MFRFQSLLSTKRLSLLFLSLALLSALSLAVILGTTYRQTYLVLKVVSSRQAPVKVYFKTGGDFHEQYSAMKMVSISAVAQFLYFSVPSQRISSIRIDPNADIKILDTALVDRQAALIKQLDPADLIALHHVEIAKTDAQGVQVSIKGADPQLLLHCFPRLPNNYGFKPLFALTLTCIFYSIFHFFFSLLRPVFFKYIPVTSNTTQGGAKPYNPWLHRLHILFLIFGASGLAGGGILWHFEGKNSLDQDQGKHSLVPYLFESSAQPVRFKRQSDALPLAALLYKPLQTVDKQPAILLLHGNYPQGSNFPLYRVMGAELSRRGYMVLAMDFAGYGESADPFSVGSIAGFDLHADALSGLRFLRQQPGVDENNLHIAGHSMGADPAISVGSTIDAVRSIALIGPPRRVHERFNYQPDVDFFWNWALHARKTIYKKQKFPSWFTKEVWQKQILDRDMVHFLPYFSQWLHKPVLFLDGEGDIGPDKRFLQWYACRASWPKQYVTLNKANHDCNVTARHDRIYYDQAVMTQTVDTMDQWFRRAKKQPQITDLLLNLLRRLFAVEMLKGC
ncbi:MAG: alpha/beta hydrolase [Candidatus Electrothrix sp. AR4]|nr:alpha/beta hydrolase [Candidatus Electrothrix sp. AR4]